MGFIAAADHGTLYLDELGSLPAEDQVKLLRVLESKDVFRVGDTDARRVDVRVVSSVQERPATLLASGSLRLDLCERLAGVVISLPPLREREDDVYVLANHFARRLGKTLRDDADGVLREYGWPGNVRELRAVIERAAALSDGDGIDARVVADAIALGAAEVVASRETVFEERDYLIAVCKANDWHAGRTATALGIARVTLYRRLKAAGLVLRTEKRVHRFRAAYH